MSFWKSLFGGGSDEGKGGAASGPVTQKSVEHNGFKIEAQPYMEAGQYQLAGTISKEIGGEVKQHRYVRADRFAAMEDAVEMAIMKGRQIIDQQGERIFN